jgi:hypothetical protein
LFNESSISLRVGGLITLTPFTVSEGTEHCNEESGKLATVIETTKFSESSESNIALALFYLENALHSCVVILQQEWRGLGSRFRAAKGMDHKKETTGLVGY